MVGRRQARLDTPKSKMQTGVGVCILIADLVGSAGGEQQQQEPLRATPDMLPPSATPTRGASPARAFTDEPTCMDEEVVGTGAGDPVLATNVAGEGDASSPLVAGKLFATTPFYFFHDFLSFLHLDPWFWPCLTLLFDLQILPW